MIVWLVAAGLVLFLAGFVPGYMKGRSLDRTVAHQRDIEKVYRLRDLLGTTFLQVTLRNYGLAQQNASEFFGQARNVVNQTDSSSLRATLEDLLSRRDRLAAELGRGAPEAFGHTQEMYRILTEQTQALLRDSAESAR
jgi:hypothetical protein